MANWTNPPKGKRAPVTGVPPSPAWTKHINSIYDMIDPDGVFKRFRRTRTSSRTVDWYLDGDTPTNWGLVGNKRKGNLDFNIWARTYPVLRVQTYRVVTIRYLLVQVSGIRELAKQEFWTPVGKPKTYRNAQIYVVKPASVRKQGTYLKLDPDVSIQFGGDSVKVRVGGLKIDFPDIPIVEDEETKIDTPPTPNTDLKPPRDAKQGDPAKDRSLLPQFSMSGNRSDLPVRRTDEDVTVAVGLEPMPASGEQAAGVYVTFGETRIPLPLDSLVRRNIILQLDTTETAEMDADPDETFFGEPVLTDEEPVEVEEIEEPAVPN